MRFQGWPPDVGLAGVRSNFDYKFMVRVPPAEAAVGLARPLAPIPATTRSSSRRPLAGLGGDFSGGSQYGLLHHEISNEAAGAAPGTHEADRRRAEASGS